jgi:hypothetical protein
MLYLKLEIIILFVPKEQTLFCAADMQGVLRDAPCSNLSPIIPSKGEWPEKF